MTHNAKNKLFATADFEGGEVVWDIIDVDPDLPVEPQFPMADESLLWVRFPNGCQIDVLWAVYQGERPHFSVLLLQPPAVLEKDVMHYVLDSRDCYSFSDLQAAVR